MYDLKNVLSDYSRKSFLSELFHSVGTKKATQLFVFLDKHYHQTEMIISKEWKHLQGSALGVIHHTVMKIFKQKTSINDVVLALMLYFISQTAFHLFAMINFVCLTHIITTLFITRQSFRLKFIKI